jgi:hypothetical protein
VHGEQRSHRLLPREAFLLKRQKLRKRYFLPTLTAPLTGNYIEMAPRLPFPSLLFINARMDIKEDAFSGYVFVRMTVQ